MMALGMSTEDSAVRAFLKSLAEFIRLRPEIFASFALDKTFDPNSTEDAMRFENTCDDVEKWGIFGGDLETQAAAILLNVAITVDVLNNIHCRHVDL
jgi:hypothetical protein